MLNEKCTQGRSKQWKHWACLNKESNCYKLLKISGSVLCSILICLQTEDVECIKLYKCLHTLDTLTTTSYIPTNKRILISTTSGRDRKSMLKLDIFCTITGETE